MFALVSPVSRSLSIYIYLHSFFVGGSSGSLDDSSRGRLARTTEKKLRRLVDLVGEGNFVIFEYFSGLSGFNLMGEDGGEKRWLEIEWIEALKGGGISLGGGTSSTILQPGDTALIALC